MALGDKVEELQRNMATVMERVDSARKSLRIIDNEHKESARLIADLRREFEKEMALVKRELEEIKKWREEQKKEHDESQRRLWAFGPNVVGAIISGIIAAAVAYFVARR